MTDILIYFLLLACGSFTLLGISLASATAQYLRSQQARSRRCRREATRHPLTGASTGLDSFRHTGLASHARAGGMGSAVSAGRFAALRRADQASSLRKAARLQRSTDRLPACNRIKPCRAK